MLRPHEGDPPAGRQRRGDGLHQRQLRRRLQAEECLHIHAGTSTAVVKQSMKGEMKKENSNAFWSRTFRNSLRCTSKERQYCKMTIWQLALLQMA